jgi:uncharacterized protein YjbI with pentapeptide repeats
MYYRNCAAVLILTSAFINVACGDIYRWDNGKVIPGTEGRTLTLGSDFSGLDLEYADLSGVYVEGVNLSGADLYRSDLSYGRMDGGSLENANVAEANMTGRYFSVVNLKNANFAGSTINWAGFPYSKLTKDQLYTTASYQAKDLKGIQLHNNDLTDWSFSGAGPFPFLAVARI